MPLQLTLLRVHRDSDIVGSIATILDVAAMTHRMCLS
jgi:hypothetical protein